MNSHQKQKGEFLLEILIAMLLLSIMSLGNSMYFNKLSNSLAQLKQYSFVVNQMKNSLQTIDAQSLCKGEELNSIYIPIDQKDYAITAEDCVNEQVVLKHFEQNSSQYTLIDLTDFEVKEYQSGLTINANEYAIGL